MKKLIYFTIAFTILFSVNSCDTLDTENIYDYNADLVWDEWFDRRHHDR